jgi:hypothetical protein
MLDSDKKTMDAIKPFTTSKLAVDAANGLLSPSNEYTLTTVGNASALVTCSASALVVTLICVLSTLRNANLTINIQFHTPFTPSRPLPCRSSPTAAFSTLSASSHTPGRSSAHTA